jgi:hypothetical protein
MLYIAFSSYAASMRIKNLTGGRKAHAICVLGASSMHKYKYGIRTTRTDSNSAQHHRYTTGSFQTLSAPLPPFTRGV